VTSIVSLIVLFFGFPVRVGSKALDAERRSNGLRIDGFFEAPEFSAAVGH
jgi:hypothetical protein